MSERNPLSQKLVTEKSENNLRSLLPFAGALSLSILAAVALLAGPAFLAALAGRE